MRRRGIGSYVRTPEKVAPGRDAPQYYCLAMIRQVVSAPASPSPLRWMRVSHVHVPATAGGGEVLIDDCNWVNEGHGPHGDTTLRAEQRLGLIHPL